jgi:hypothetical protein
MKFEPSAILAITLAAALAGCTTVGGGVSENLKTIPPGKGIALFSTSADQTSLSFSTYLTLVEGSSFRKYDKVIINIDYPLFSSHFGNLHGHARSLVLPAGDYYFRPSSGNPYFIVTEAPIYKFKVSEGHISYLGNVHLSGNHLQFSTNFYDRDVAFFQRKNPDLSTVSITRSPLENGPKFSEFRISGIIWDAPQ